MNEESYTQYRQQESQNKQLISIVEKALSAIKILVRGLADVFHEVFRR